MEPGTGLITHKAENMAARIDIYPEKALVVLTYSGEIDDKELIQPFTSLSAHPDFDPSFSEIVDFSQARDANVSTEAIRKMAQSTSLYHTAARHAVVAPQHHVYGLVRMYQTLAEATRPNLIVVRSVDEAYARLGIVPPGKEEQY